MNAFLSTFIVSSFFSQPIHGNGISGKSKNESKRAHLISIRPGERELRNQLLTKSDPWSLPSRNNGDPVQVFLETSALINGINFRKNLITLDLWFWMMWKDESLSWDPILHHNMTEISVDSSKVWKPDVTLYNSHSGPSRVLCDEPGKVVTITSDGYVHLVQPRSLIATCSLDVTFFPFDQHQCQLILGSWSHHLGKLNLTPKNGNLLTIHKTHTPGWKVTHEFMTRDELHFDNDTFAAIKVFFQVDRSSRSFYDIYVKHQLVLIILTILIVHLIPPKLITIRIIILLFTIVLSLGLMTVISNEIGFKTNCNLLRFLSIILLVSGLLVFSVTIVYLIGSKLYNSPLPMRLASTVNGTVGRILMLEFSAISYDLGTEMEKRNTGTGPLCIVIQEEWLLFSVLIDRISMLICFIAMISFFPSFS